MVKGTHQVLDSVARDEGQALRGGLNTGQVVDQLSRIRLMLGANSIRLCIDEPTDFALQVRDVFPGPFDF